MRLQVAAAFARGAAGAVMGTCLAATKEGMYLEEKKQCYLAAKAAVTHQNRKRGHDDLGAVPCPAGIDGRVTGNTFSNSHGTVAPAEVGQVSSPCFPSLDLSSCKRQAEQPCVMWATYIRVAWHLGNTASTEAILRSSSSSCACLDLQQCATGQKKLGVF